MNAKDEFLEHVKEVKPAIKCAEISHGGGYWDESRKRFHLKLNHTESDYKLFLNSLNFIYDSGYGGQELFGIIWYVDGTFSERGEYDGSEWWEYKTTPEIPKELL